ncbi:hypothetical protein [Lacibacter sp.]|uniref:hypothetical protein n=1 Tax=Lacibacter sp. TaxID=1915409 RepID=UPI002B4B77F0|nr:hypothetical protein [Lacibacter sp.]HLP39534.1 hypothetical protein [Lacibacter sp.]
MRKISFILFLFLQFALAASAQLQFVFVPELHGRSVDGLGSFQLQNLSGQVLKGKLFITVRENTRNTSVVQVMTPVITITQGVSGLPKAVFHNSSFQFSPGSYGAIASQTRNFPTGEYSFCFRFVPENKNLDEYENCFDGTIQPLVPLTLLSPGLKDTICIRRPVLSWQPPLPYSQQMRFRLILTEKTAGESVESLLKNRPLLLLDHISATTITYPSANPELKEGKTYCWQVIAYEQGLIVSRSEIWEFTVKCNETPKPTFNDSYRELKFLSNGNYYIANRSIRFAFKNDYNIKKLQYSITEIEHGGKPIKSLPEIALKQGLNLIDIDLTDMDLKEGKYYVLKVFPFNEPPIEIRFVYRDFDDTVN